MSGKKSKKPAKPATAPGATFPRTDRQALAVLIVVSALIRLPLFKYFNLVAFDGTYYINQARALWPGGAMPGQFPIGYPLFISLLFPFTTDDVAAAQLVSVLASLGSLALLFLIAREFLSRHLAFYCAGFLALTPLFVRMSMLTMSESLYTCAVLLTLLLYLKRRDFPAGLAAGLAAITRPEMLAVAALLTLWRLRSPSGLRRAVMMLAGFTLVYAINVGVFYRASGRVVLLQKTENLGMRAQSWWDREEGVDAATGDVETEQLSTGRIAAAYLSALPGDAWSLVRHCAVVLILFAIYGAARHPTFLLFALVPFFSISLFAPRGYERFFLPYIPIVILYAFVGADRLSSPRLRSAGLWTLAAAVALGAVLNFDRLTTPDDQGVAVQKEVGLELSDAVRPGDQVADRKPYTAFYAGADYVEIPKDNYDATMTYLSREGIRFLSLTYNVVTAVRPALAPLLTNPDAVLGELRYRQAYHNPDGAIVYERTGNGDGLTWKRLATVETGRIASPAWSADGRRIFFVVKDDDDSSIHVVGADGNSEATVVVNSAGRDDHPAVSRDGTRLAFASTMAGNYDLFILDIASGETRRLTDHAANDGAPSWFPDGASIAFVSDRGGNRDLWRIDVGTGAASQLTRAGGINFPAVSPSGERVAFVHSGGGVGAVELDGGEAATIPGPTQVQYPPAWSPSGQFIAVTGSDWGSADVYLLMPSTGRHLLLTKNYAADGRPWFDGYPAFSPRQDRLAVVSTHEGTVGLYVLDGLEPYYARLRQPVDMATFEDVSAE